MSSERVSSLSLSFSVLVSSLLATNSTVARGSSVNVIPDGMVLVRSAGLEGPAALFAEAFGQAGVLPVSAAVGAFIMIWGLYTLLEGSRLGYKQT